MPNEKYLNLSGLKKTIESIKEEIDNRLKNKISSVSSGNNDHINIDSTDPNNITIDLSLDLVNKIQTMWDIVNNGIGKEEIPAPVIDFIKEKLVNLIPNALYEVNATPHYSNANGEIGMYQSWIGSTINIVKKSTSPGKTDSDSKEITITQRPEKPMIRISGNTITGVNNTMEWKESYVSTWNDITGSTLSNLANTTYDIRIKAKEVSFSSSISVALINPSGFIPVTNIVGIPTQMEQSTWDRIIDVDLDGIVIPNNATNYRIEWSIVEDGGTSMSISKNDKLRAYGLGVMGIKAKVTNGVTNGTSFIKHFNIEVVPPHTLTK